MKTFSLVPYNFKSGKNLGLIRKDPHILDRKLSMVIRQTNYEETPQDLLRLSMSDVECSTLYIEKKNSTTLKLLKGCSLLFSINLDVLDKKFYVIEFPFWLNNRSLQFYQRIFNYEY